MSLAHVYKMQVWIITTLCKLYGEYVFFASNELYVYVQMHCAKTLLSSFILPLMLSLSKEGYDHK